LLLLKTLTFISFIIVTTGGLLRSSFTYTKKEKKLLYSGKFLIAVLRIEREKTACGRYLLFMKNSMSPVTLDSQMLLDLYGGSSDDACFILNDYLTKHAEIISSFNEAYHSGIESLSKCAHRHASSFSYIGMPQLTVACREFEGECKNAKNAIEVKKSFELLLTTIDESAVLVKQELNRLERA
jgi:HPt (histidine-containing phosphotransfer) domain-containing protein